MKYVGNFRYVVTTLPSRNIHDVTNGNVTKCSESAKHHSRRTVVNSIQFNSIQFYSQPLLRQRKQIQFYFLCQANDGVPYVGNQLVIPLLSHGKRCRDDGRVTVTSQRSASTTWIDCDWRFHKLNLDLV